MRSQKRSRRIGRRNARFSPAIERLEVRQLLVGELLELDLNARSLSDELLLDDDRVLHLQVGDRFDLEVSYDDLRLSDDERGVFQLFTDIAISHPEVVVPVLNETQQIIIDESIIQSPFAESLTFSIPNGPPNIDGALSYESLFNDFENNPTSEMANALLAFGYTADQFEVDGLSFHNNNVGFQIHWIGDLFGNVDLPNVHVEVNEAPGVTNVPTETIEFAPFLADGTPNGEAVRFNLNTYSRTFNANKRFYASHNIGFFDINTGFVSVGGVGKLVQGISQATNDESFAQPFDAYSLRLEVVSPATDVTFSVAPALLQDSVVLYGREDLVPPDLVLLNAKSFFTANFFGDPSTKALEDEATLDEDTIASIDVLANDEIPSGQTILSVTPDSVSAAGGLLVWDDMANRILYTPPANFNGVDQFSYEVVTDAPPLLGRSSATVSVTVTAINDAPLVTDDTIDAVEDTVLAFESAALLTNDLDVDEDPLSVVSVGDATSGTVTISSGTIEYTPAADFAGTDTFTYTMSDGTVEATGTVTVEVAAVNDAPVALDDVLRVAPGQPTMVNVFDALLVNDTAGPSESEQTISIFEISESSAEGGTITVEDGQLTYTPPNQFTGSDSFAYQIVDNEEATSAVATVTIDVSYEQESVVLELSKDTGNNVTVRREGIDLIVVDNSNGSVLLNRPIGAVFDLSIVGASDFADTIHIDHRTGGLIGYTNELTFLGQKILPINIDGGVSQGDQVTVSGTSDSIGVFFHTTEDIAGRSTATVNKDSNLVRHELVGFESITYNEMQRIELKTEDLGIPASINIEQYELYFSALVPIDVSDQIIVAGGMLRSDSTIAVGAGEAILGNGQIDASIAGAVGSLIRANGDLTIGDPTSTTGFETLGELEVGAHSVTLADANQSVLGSRTALGDESGGGTLASQGGFLIDFGANIVGHGTLLSTNGESTALLNNGLIIGDSDQQPLMLRSFIQGVGRLDNAVVEGTLSPGFSPSISDNGTVVYGSDSRVVAEFAGPEAGTGYDQINHEGVASLSGTLDVQLIDGFQPSAGQRFNVFRSEEGIAGSFAGIDLPVVADGLQWITSKTATEVILELGIDVEQIGGKVNLVIVDGAFDFRGTDGQVVASSGESVTLRVTPTDVFESEEPWRLVSTEVIDDALVQRATSGDLELQIRGASWTNFVLPSDVDGSGTISALDALQIVNQLSRRTFVEPDTSRLVDPATLETFPGRFYDVNGDQALTALDALNVINRIPKISSSNGELLSAESLRSEDETLQRIALDRLGIPSLGSKPDRVASFDQALSSWEDEPHRIAFSDIGARSEVPFMADTVHLLTGNTKQPLK